MAARYVLIGSMVLMPLVAAAQTAQRYEGLPLLEALRLLQAAGLRIVFSSETVTPAMKVAAEPKGPTNKARLDQVLAPHGLRARPGPGGTLVIVREAAVPPPAARAPRVRERAADAPPATHYREAVTVEAPLERRVEPGVASQTSVGRSELAAVRPVVADDPLRAVQALPHVAAGDDFRSEFSIRGSPYRNVGLVIDGVATRRLQHTAYGRGDTGSLSMLHGDLIEDATLRAGAYPQQYGAMLGGQLALTVREGSRRADAFRVALSPSSAAVVAEGPFGSADDRPIGARGSWLISARQSYRDWPTRGYSEFDGTMFGFTDALAKVVCDVRPRHQLIVSVLGGHSHVDEVDGGMSYQPGDGRNRTAIVNLGVRSTFGSRLVLTQRAYVVGHEFLNKTEAGQPYSRGSERELTYRADLTRAVPGGLLASGAQVQHLRGDRAAGWSGAAYAHYQWRLSSRLTIAPGFRADRSTLMQSRPIGRWVLGELVLDPRWIARASAGVSYQLPQVEQAADLISAVRLEPERATHVDVGLARRIRDAFRVQTTLYLRRERDVLRPPQAAGEPWRNALRGSAHGVEVLLERRRPTAVSGWIAYSFGKTRHTDLDRGETYWADFDQRHALNAYGAYRMSERSTMSLTFRSGTNFPIPAYLERRDGALFSADERNGVRLRPYARLDVRASRSFRPMGRLLTVYVEVLNVLNRGNVGLANGTISSTGEASGFTERLMPRLPSAGIVVEF